jgi:hypothetical protein
MTVDATDVAKIAETAVKIDVDKMEAGESKQRNNPLKNLKRGKALAHKALQPPDFMDVLFTYQVACAWACVALILVPTALLCMSTAWVAVLLYLALLFALHHAWDSAAPMAQGGQNQFIPADTVCGADGGAIGGAVGGDVDGHAHGGSCGGCGEATYAAITIRVSDAASGLIYACTNIFRKPGVFAGAGSTRTLRPASFTSPVFVLPVRSALCDVLGCAAFYHCRWQFPDEHMGSKHHRCGCPPTD